MEIFQLVGVREDYSHHTIVVTERMSVVNDQMDIERDIEALGLPSPFTRGYLVISWLDGRKYTSDIIER